MQHHIEKRIKQFDRVQQKVNKRITRVAALRVIFFLVLVGAGVSWLRGPYPIASSLVFLAVVALFTVLLVIHDRLYKSADRLRCLLELLRLDQARSRHDFARLAEEREPRFPADHAFAADLDFGQRNSALKLLDNSFHGQTKRLLASWMSQPAPAATLEARQHAVEELARQRHFRLKLGVACRLHSIPELSSHLPHEWLDHAPPWTISMPVYILGRLFSLATLTALILKLFFGVDQIPIWPILIGQTLVIYGFDAAHRGYLFSFMKIGKPIMAAIKLVGLFERRKVQAQLLGDLQQRLREGGETAGAGLEKLFRIHEFLEYRANGLAHFILNLLFLWDQHQLFRLHRWRRRYGDALPHWIDAIFELEALSAAANFRWMNPGYCYPEFRAEGKVHMAAEGLGHPAIPPNRRVGNDFTLEDNKVYLITGSNMSGKSTFLRTIGVNMVFARLGAPVCAARMCCTLPALWTSIRITDSLADGVSYFYAEVRRLKQILDQIETGGEPVLYLLDEILKGTNSRERLIASKALVRFLMGHPTSGLITTHDLELLALAERYPEAIRTFHFQEQVDDEEMTFDYRLKPGRLTSTNALRVMKLAKLPLAFDQP